MSGFFGVYHRDGRPQNSNILNQMAESLDHRGPNGTDIWQEGAVGLGHCMLWTTPESLKEKLPFVDNESGLVITSDARIDNREELAAQLGLIERLKAGVPDSQLILASYKKWGEKCVDHLLGDFAFVIWDGRNNRLFCGRDIFGIKPFYYYLSDNIFIFGSEIKQVAEHPLVPLEFNEGILAEYLSDNFISKDETHFVDVKRLPAAHFIILELNNLRICNYWELKPQKRIWYKHDKEYVEHFLDIFGKAVRCRLRSNKKVGAYLSGGLDSSSIVGMANYLGSNEKNPKINTFSLSFPGRGCDESYFIDAVVRKWKCASHKIKSDLQQKPNWLQHMQQTKEIADPPNLTMMDPLLEEVRFNDIHVMLSGIGGDELFNSSAFGYLDLIHKRDLKNLIAEFKFNARSGKNRTLLRFAASILWPMFPQSIRSKITHYKLKPDFPPWISNRIKEQIEERIYSKTHNIGMEFTNLSDRKVFALLMAPWLVKVFELNDRYCSYYHVENRYPYFDRRLVEFALAIPEYERGRQNITKYILRKAGRYLLPEQVIERKDKAEFSCAFADAIKSYQKDNSLYLEKIIDMGFISNQEILIDKFNQFFDIDTDKNYVEDLWPLWFAYSIDLIFRKFQFKK